MEKSKEERKIIFKGNDFYIVSGFNQNNEKYYKKFEANNYLDNDTLKQLLKIYEKNGFFVKGKTIIAKKERCICIDDGDEVIKLKNGKIIIQKVFEKEKIFRTIKGLEDNINDAGKQSNN